MCNAIPTVSGQFQRDIFQPEVTRDVKCDTAVDKVSLGDVDVKFGDSMSNRSRVNRRAHFILKDA